MARIVYLAAAALVALSLPAAAEVTLSFYTGVQEAPHSRVTGEDGDRDFDFLSAWEGRSGEAPPHYGFRATWWRTENLGYGVEFNHTKVYASDETLEDNDLSTLEFSDGLNSLTANVFYRWPGQWGSGKLTPYVGAGLGLSIPHVEFNSGNEDTFEYQIAGPSAMWVGGVSYAINESWSIFGEYKGTYSSNTVDLEGGGELQTDIVTNAVNFGLSYNF